MNFIDKEHEKFWDKQLEKMKELGKTDVYYKSLVYTLGICESTREHFSDIFDLKDGSIKINGLNSAWQTGTSEKVTRMAFSLWNKCNFDSENDMEKNQLSSYYNISEIFSCSYAPYFYEAIKIRYPEYTREKINEKTNYYGIEEKIKDLTKEIIGIYIRGNEQSILQQKIKISKFCSEKNFENKIIYVDEGFSSMSVNRPAYKKLLEDIENNKIKKVIISDPARLNRDIVNFLEFFEMCKEKNIELISLDGAVDEMELKNLAFFKETISEAEEDEDMEIE